MSNGEKKNNKKYQYPLLVDFRNGKYQGMLSEASRVPDGIG